MQIIELPITAPLTYHYTGKFEAPTDHWTHENFSLTEYELFVMTEGTLYISYNHIDYTVKKGEFLLLAPINLYAHRQGFRPSFCSFYWLHFKAPEPPLLKEIPNALFSSFLLSAPKNQIYLPQQAALPMPEKVVVLMKQLQDAVKSDYPESALDYMTTSVLLEVFSQFYTNNHTLIRSKASQKQIYHDIVDYIKLNLSRNIKVSEIAAHFGYNEKYLSHFFVSVAGIPLKQFILTCKMDAANFMLTDTNKSISSIAEELGFSDNHNFTRAYKKITGLTPSEYRNAFSRRMLFHK